MYIRPTIDIISIGTALLSCSGPGATDIGSPTVSSDAKKYSVWDEVDNTYNNNKEENYEVYE